MQQALQGHATFRFIALLLGFSFQILVVKILSPENYAIYAVLLATLVVGERLLSFGTDRTLLRFLPAVVSRKDRAGLKFIATRLGLLRATALTLLVVTITSTPVLQHITPGELGGTTTTAFAVLFVSYSLLKEWDAVAQSLILHHWAASAAACEVVLRLGGLSVMYFFFRATDVETVVVVYAATSSVAAAGLPLTMWLAIRRRWIPALSSSPSQNDVVVDLKSQIPRFASAAYASTLSYLTSSSGVVRLVARTGLDIHALAAFSFVQSLSASLSSALPGQLILPSLESIAAKMADSGRGEEIFPALSVVFKAELTCMLAMIVATTIAGREIIGALSRPEYAPYYYALPILLVGLCLHTAYRVLEILGSVNLKYTVFLTLWPLSLIAMGALYLTVGRWGLVSVLVLPIMEVSGRVGMLAVALRGHGVQRALDPARSSRMLLSAVVVLLLVACVLKVSGESLQGNRLILAVAGVGLFLSSLFVVRPLNAAECVVLGRMLPGSWTFPRAMARRLSRP